MTKKTLIIVAVLAIAIAFMIIGAVSKASTPPAEEPPASAVESPASDAAPTTPATPRKDPNLSQDLPPADEAAVLGTVQSFILAYTGQRWDDSTASSWVERATSFTTAPYGSELRSMYGKEGSDRGWNEIVQARIVRQAIIDDLEIVQSQDLSKGSVTVLARYRISTAAEGSVPESFEPFTKMVIVQKAAAGWEVAAFTAPVSGSVPELPRPVLTPANPPVIDDHVHDDHAEHSD